MGCRSCDLGLQLPDLGVFCGHLFCVLFYLLCTDGLLSNARAAVSARPCSGSYAVQRCVRLRRLHRRRLLYSEALGNGAKVQAGELEVFRVVLLLRHREHGPALGLHLVHGREQCLLLIT